MKRILTTIVLLAVCLCADARLALRQPTSDGMVLQQQTSAAVWGKSTPGATVTVTPSWGSRSYKAKADARGFWTVMVSTPTASYKHHSIKVTGDGGSITINDVLVGEVWIASGQSNMEMPIRGFFNCPVEGANEVISAAPLTDKVRMMTVDIYQPDEPIDEVHSTKGWQDAGPETVSEMSATAFFFARKLNSLLNVPVGILALPRGGASVESWLPKSTLKAWGDDVSPEKIGTYTEWTVPYRMYNGMEQPVKGYTAKGFIWYQGCTNVGNEDVFVERMTELVRQWREDWGDADASMPFYQVEIAPYRYKNGQAGHAAALRAAQHEAAHAIPNSGCVVTNDLAYSYEIDNIHPCQKQPVGERLAYMALHRDYGFERIACESPEAVEAFKTDGLGSEICVRLSNCANGLDRWMEIEGLEVCGSEHVWKPVRYAYYESDSRGGYLRIRSEDVFDPTEVRYGWGDFKPGNLHNAEGLPVAPFTIAVNNNQ